MVVATQGVATLMRDAARTPIEDEAARVAEDALKTRIGRIIGRAARDIAGPGYQRKDKRALVRHVGLIETADGARHDCLIEDMTGAGMRLTLFNDAELPPQFIVLVPALRLKCAVRRRWKRDGALGVEIRIRANWNGVIGAPRRRPAKAVAAATPLCDWINDRRPASGEVADAQSQAACGPARRFVGEAGGGAAIEYALLVALIASVIVIGVASTGVETRGAFSEAASAITDANGSAGAPEADGGGPDAGAGAPPAAPDKPKPGKKKKKKK